MNVDPSGNSWDSFWAKVGIFLAGLVLTAVGAAISISTLKDALINPLATVACEFGLTVGFYGAALMGSVFDETIYNDMTLIGWNPYNGNAEATAQSQKMSFYKGAPCLWVPMSSGRSGSYGIILFNSANRASVNADTVRHEFGHIPQLMMLGIIKYGLCIGIPSKDYWCDRAGWPYYVAPWDAGADYFGGVQGRPISEESKNRALIYMLLSYILGPIVHSFYKKL